MHEWHQIESALPLLPPAWESQYNDEVKYLLAACLMLDALLVGEHVPLNNQQLVHTALSSTGVVGVE